MKNKGFVLMETIVVIVVISVALLTIFSSYIKILTKVKTENKYDTSEYIYMTNYIKENLENTISPDDIYPNCAPNCEDDDFSITNYSDSIIDTTINNFNVKKIYILTDINNFDKKIKADGTKNSTYFDAYMIDYIRKLDVGDTDKLIIVEYKRLSMDKNYNERKMYYYDESGAKQEKNLERRNYEVA